MIFNFYARNKIELFIYLFFKYSLTLLFTDLRTTSIVIPVHHKLVVTIDLIN